VIPCLVSGTKRVRSSGEVVVQVVNATPTSSNDQRNSKFLRVIKAP